ncbi:hypothetical protein ACFE04_024533 [Oxalis oulophora]
MGGCASSPKWTCICSSSSSSSNKEKHQQQRKRRRSRVFKRRVSEESLELDHQVDTHSAPAPLSDDHHHHSYTNPTFQGNVVQEDEAWFDSVAKFYSDCEEDDDEEDFKSASGNLSQGSSHSDDITKYGNTMRSSSEISAGGSKQIVNHNDISSDKEESSGDGHGGLLDDCGIIPSNCLPFLASTAHPIEKRRSLSSSPPGSRRKTAPKVSFKWKEGHGNSSLCEYLCSPSSRFHANNYIALLQRPIAGSQVPFCPIEKKTNDSWSKIEPSSFKVRGNNYLRDRKKEFASNCAAYSPFGVDVFLSPRKVDHIARFVELPAINVSGKLPPLLVVNVQIPLYPAAIFQSDTDGEGMNIVLYFKLSENYSKELQPHFQESIRKLIDDEVERVKGFPLDTIAPFRERLKILGHVGNVEDLPLSAPERKLMNAYNEKPILSRPQHEFYLGENYFEIDIDMHRFNYISRKGFHMFMDRLKGNKAEELPEQILCCIRVNCIDYANYQQLGLSQETLDI